MKRKRTKLNEWLQIITALQEFFPATFAVLGKNRRPLSIGIRESILEALAGAITAEELGPALGWYCGSTEYQRTLMRGGERVGLDGRPAGVVSEADAEAARLLVLTRSTREKARLAPVAAVKVTPEPEVAPRASLGASGSPPANPVAPPAKTAKPKPAGGASLSDLRRAAALRKVALNA